MEVFLGFCVFYEFSMLSVILNSLLAVKHRDLDKFLRLICLSLRYNTASFLCFVIYYTYIKSATIEFDITVLAMICLIIKTIFCSLIMVNYVRISDNVRGCYRGRFYLSTYESSKYLKQGFILSFVCAALLFVYIFS